jgi:hypothetical protein
MQIDDKFDFNKFNIKRIPMTIMYSKDNIYNWRTKETIKVGDIEMRKMNTRNCFEEKVYDMSGFRLNGKSKIETDINLFVRNIDDVTTILQNKCVDWKNNKYKIAEYNVKFLPSKKNIKTFRFVLHSYTNRAHNLEKREDSWRQLYEYYINGNSIDERLWKKYSREYKLSRILK